MSIVRRWHFGHTLTLPSEYRRIFSNLLSNLLKIRHHNHPNPHSNNWFCLSMGWWFFRHRHKPNKCLPNHWDAHTHPFVWSVGNWANDEFTFMRFIAFVQCQYVQEVVVRICIYTVTWHCMPCRYLNDANKDKKRMGGATEKKTHTHYDWPSWSLFGRKWTLARRQRRRLIFTIGGGGVEMVERLWSEKTSSETRTDREFWNCGR